MQRYVPIAILLGLLTTHRGAALTLEELRAEPHLTPKLFAKHFREFKYEYHEDVQEPEIFLLTQAGDCDDYAVLADSILRPRGYATRLVFIRMPGLISHVVCYVSQDKAYLDYNNRIYPIRLERSGPGLRDIATRVAQSFGANWTSATEFIYLGNNLKRFGETVAKTDPPAGTAPERKSPPIRIDF